jgi:hypothetical protein
MTINTALIFECLFLSDPKHELATSHLGAPTKCCANSANSELKANSKGCLHSASQQSAFKLSKFFQKMDQQMNVPVDNPDADTEW